ncbi:MAG: hypothetical protein IPQ14_11425 [Candidatus Microthrix sp.]|uniref:hypothetical protein n=1 Tax=Candidatus Neomicrothrix sp. TaxID=2719034 RepID=UPI0025BB0900|nr:hypothetical protein [Candidatus Microthrix sp.]MBL0204904.1 hypothetical protein [Candidatus Microthrix sp.]
MDESLDELAVSKAELQRQLHQRVVAASAFPSVSGNLVLDEVSGLRHLHVLGPSGVGKSTLLANLILQDIAAERGVVVVDPKDDLVDDVLRRLPSKALERVAVLDPTDRAPLVLTRWQSGTGGAGSGLAVEGLFGLLHSLWAGVGGDHGWEMCCTLDCDVGTGTWAQLGGAAAAADQPWLSSAVGGAGTTARSAGTGGLLGMV